MGTAIAHGHDTAYCLNAECRAVFDAPVSHRQIFRCPHCDMGVAIGDENIAATRKWADTLIRHFAGAQNGPRKLGGAA